MSNSVYNPPVPHTGHISGGFMPGRTVRVQGRVTPSAQSFQINLQTGPNAYDDVALHLNPRFNESIIVRNSRAHSGWGAEERHGPPLSIYRDQNFEILIMSESNSYRIAVNGQHFAEFAHRLPLDRISYILVEGDLTLSLIQFDGTLTQSNAYSATAPPMGYVPPPTGHGSTPYPPASSLPMPGFTMPAHSPTASPYAPAGIPPQPGYPAPTPQAYGGYPQAQPQQYPPPNGAGYYPQQPAYAAGGAPGGYYQPQAHHTSGGSSGGGMMSGATKLLAGGLAGVGLAKVANKIPGLGGGGGHGHGHGHQGYHAAHGGHQGYPGDHGGHYGYPATHGGHQGGGGGLGGAAGGILGTAAALGIGGVVANKAMKKKKGNKLLKYGVPVGGAVLGGYALKKGMKGFKHGHGSSSSSSSSSEEE